MKKLLFAAVLFASISSFANSGKVVNRIDVKPTAVACCVVGPFKSCGYAWEPLCDRARAQYCSVYPCAPTNPGGPSN